MDTNTNQTVVSIFQIPEDNRKALANIGVGNSKNQNAPSTIAFWKHWIFI
jgi:hypothetical protein